MDTVIKYVKLLTPLKGAGFLESVSHRRLENEHHPTKHLFQERLVFSFLAYRSKHDLGTTLNEIARETTLDKRSVSRCLTTLVDVVHRHQGLWHANEPPGGWFIARTKGTGPHWLDQLAYTKLYLPRKQAHVTESRRFGLNHAAVYSFILSYSGKSDRTSRLSVRLLGQLLNGVDRKTVRRILDDLGKVGWIRFNVGTKRLRITVQELTNEHLELFESVAENTSRERADTISPKPVEVYNYEDKGDGFDDYRAICQPFMPQSYAERIVTAIAELDWTTDEFKQHLTGQKKKSVENVRTGQCSFENFGKFLTTALEKQVKAIHEKRREFLRELERQEALQRQQQWLESPEGQEWRREQKQIIAADPLHPEHDPDYDSIKARVHFHEDYAKNHFRATRACHHVCHTCDDYLSMSQPSWHKRHKEVDSLARDILKEALHRLNRYYQQDTLASADEFQEAVNSAAAKVAPDIRPIFEASSAPT